LKLKKNFRKQGFGALLLVLVLGLVAIFAVGKQAMVSVDQGVVEGTNTGGGFDQYGYNYQARLFQGAADGVDRNLDGTVWGDPTYAKDHLVMKWSKGWDDARFHGAAWSPDAWEDNEWNGNVPGGSGFSEHYKIIWVGPALANSQLWRPGGYDVWGEFEVIMDQGTSKGTKPAHAWYTIHVTPAGYGAK